MQRTLKVVTMWELVNKINFIIKNRFCKFCKKTRIQSKFCWKQLRIRSLPSSNLFYGNETIFCKNLLDSHQFFNPVMMYPWNSIKNVLCWNFFGDSLVRGFPYPDAKIICLPSITPRTSRRCHFSDIDARIKDNHHTNRSQQRSIKDDISL